MRVLLDECVPAPLGKLLTNHLCTTVQQKGWAGVRNGALLARAANEFDAVLTCDQNIRHQQNVATLPIAVLELSTNDLRRLRSAAVAIEAAISTLSAKRLTRLVVP